MSNHDFAARFHLHIQKPFVQRCGEGFIDGAAKQYRVIVMFVLTEAHVDLRPQSRANKTLRKIRPGMGQTKGPAPESCQD